MPVDDLLKRNFPIEWIDVTIVQIAIHLFLGRSQISKIISFVWHEFRLNWSDDSFAFVKGKMPF